jgi:hypothetical protein
MKLGAAMAARRRPNMKNDKTSSLYLNFTRASPGFHSPGRKHSDGSPDSPLFSKMESARYLASICKYDLLTTAIARRLTKGTMNFYAAIQTIIETEI